VKTITSADVLKALEMLEFNDQVELMQKELESTLAKPERITSAYIACSASIPE